MEDRVQIEKDYDRVDDRKRIGIQFVGKFPAQASQ